MIRFKNIIKVIYSIFLSVYLIITFKNINQLIFSRPFKLNISKTDFALNYYNTNTWMINKNIFQYSSHLFVRNDKLTQIDSLIITNYNMSVEYVKKSMRCLIKSIKTDQEVRLNITVVLKFLYNTLRVKCEVYGEEFENSVVAIVDIADYKKEFLDSKESINFQIPNKINIPSVKLPEIAHCVHYSYQLVQRDVQKILSWLEIQKKIGISKIILYDSNSEKLIEKEIYKLFNQDFVQVRPYLTNYESICESSRLDAYRFDNFEKYEVLKEECEDAYYKRFRDPWSETMNRWMHQKISANDCYSTFEHVFEYVSHYDFDEIIYPRSNETDIFLKENENCEAKDFCMEFGHEKKLDLYNYTNGIIPKQTNYSSNISSIYFQNAFYFPNNYHLEKLMSEIKGLITKNKTFFAQNSTISHIQIHFKFTQSIGHYFLIYPNDLEYIQKLYETFYKINCIYEKIDLQIDSSLDSNFNFYDSFFKQVLPRSYKKFFLNRSAHILCGKTVCHLRQNFSQEMLGKFLRNLLENY